MSKKSKKIADLIDHCRGREWPAHYLGYFECFNAGLFYEAHDVLEELWLPVRHNTDGKFYQGLIQLTGAFVHMQKGRIAPANALFEKARANLSLYSPLHHGLEIDLVLTLIADWKKRLSLEGPGALNDSTAPKLALAINHLTCTKEEGG